MGRLPAAIGLVHRLSAIPQYAIAHVESARSTSLKARIDAPNSKEWSSATARSNCGATAGLHDVAKCTVPNFSVGAPWACACSLVPHCAARERARQGLFARFSGALAHNPWTDVSHLNSCSSDLKH